MHKRVVDQLVTQYSEQEAIALTRWLWEDVLGISAHSHFVNQEEKIDSVAEEKLDNAVERLLLGEPIQHIVGYGYFYGRKFLVSPNVLIPRQETEELLVWIRDSHRSGEALSVVDLGTGTGCIPISLGLEWKLLNQTARCVGVDISEKVIHIASQNAEILNFHPEWITLDIFSATNLQFRDVDILISNPPYIPQQEKSGLFFNVRDRDPDLALFVPDDDPLIFYRHIAELGQYWLKTGGFLYFEVHSDFGEAVVESLRSMGYKNIELRKDLNKRDRMVRGQKN
ncbi:MAG: peptide chain release factor N(5)-glutamine methyltransferase [Bacteroidota bacterium]